MDIDIEWGRQGLHSAARNRITTAEAMRVVEDQDDTVRADSPFARWHIGATAESGVIVVIADRISGTRIHEIVEVRPADADEAALYHRKRRNR